MIKLAGALDTTVAVLTEGISWQPSRKRFDVKRPPRAKS